MRASRDLQALAATTGVLANGPVRSRPRASDWSQPSDELKRKAREWVDSHGSPLLALDCEQLRRQYRSLSSALPGVDLHYAMKALSHPAVISTLDEEGSFFDVASSNEIAILRSLEIAPERTIHTHPIKRRSDIDHALAHGCRTFVVDNPWEMQKFEPYRDVVSILLRVGFRCADAGIDLAKKFGCAPEEVLALLELARAHGVHVEGLSFHVGSQCASSRSHVAAIEGCLQLMHTARARDLGRLSTLDIGGGFPVSYDTDLPDIDAFCAPIRKALQGLPRSLRILAEPGRFLAAPAVHGVATVIGKARRSGKWWYYLDDGVFGSYNGLVYDCVRYPITAVTDASGPATCSVLAGPTCDSIDVIAEDLMLPELAIGDLIVGRVMGAYTAVSASDFNLVPRAAIVVVGRSTPSATPRVRQALRSGTGVVLRNIRQIAR